MITMLLDSETQLRWSRDWYRYVLSWRSSLLMIIMLLDCETNSLVTRLIQIRSFMRVLCAMIIMLLERETQTRWSRDWSRYVPSWKCSVLWSSCCGTVNYKLSGHAIDADTCLHEEVLCYDHHATGQWNLNSLTTRLIQIRSFMRLFCAVIIMLLDSETQTRWSRYWSRYVLSWGRSLLWSSCHCIVKHKLAGHAIDPDTFLHKDVLFMIIMLLDSETQTRWTRDWSRYVPSWGCSVLWSSCCGTVKRKLADHALDPDTFLHEGAMILMLRDKKSSSSVTFTSHTSMNYFDDRALISKDFQRRRYTHSQNHKSHPNEQLFARLGWSARHSRHGNLMNAPKCVSCESCPRTIWKKHQKRVARTGRPTPTAKPRAQRPHWSPEGRAATQTNARTITEPQGPSTSISTHTHTHTETKNQQARNRKGARTHPKKKKLWRQEGGNGRLAESPKIRRILHATFRRGRNRASHRSSRTTSGSWRG